MGPGDGVVDGDAGTSGDRVRPGFDGDGAGEGAGTRPCGEGDEDRVRLRERERGEWSSTAKRAVLDPCLRGCVSVEDWVLEVGSG